MKILPSENGENFEIFVDEEGNWFYNSSPIIREDILELFYENLHYTKEDGYYIEWMGKRCPIKVSDTPFVVTRVDKEKEGDTEKITITLKHIKEKEELALDSLFVGSNNVLYCFVRDKNFEARFSRPAYYQLAQFIEEEEGKFFINLNGVKYKIS